MRAGHLLRVSVAVASFAFVSEPRADIRPPDLHDCEDAAVFAPCFNDACERGRCMPIGKQCKLMPEGCAKCQLTELQGGPRCLPGACTSTHVDCNACLVDRPGQPRFSEGGARFRGCIDHKEGDACLMSTCVPGICAMTCAADPSMCGLECAIPPPSRFNVRALVIGAAALVLAMGAATAWRVRRRA